MADKTFPGGINIGERGSSIGLTAVGGSGGPRLLVTGATAVDGIRTQGTWTPVVGGTATYTTQEGYYWTLDKLVFIQCKLEINLSGTGSTTTISGLPFTSFNADNASAASGSVSYFASLLSTVVFITPVVVNNTSTVTFTTLAVAAATATNATAVFGNSTRIDFSAVYQAA